MLAYAFGVLGIKPKDFYRLTWNQYLLTCRGYAEKVNDKNQIMRYMLWNLMSCHIPKMPPIEKLMPLPTDKVVNEQDKAERLKQRLIAAGKKL